MNYRHAFHAGNFADVLKHAVLARMLAYLARKEAPFRVIDTHAGVGLYDLDADAATRTGEWRGGIGRLDGALSPGLAGFLDPWLSVVREVGADAGARIYPGSPVIAARLGRRQDRFVFNEKHPEDHALLAEIFAGDRRVRATDTDGYVTVRASLPPEERRGLVVIDPPFEEAGEFDRMLRAIEDAGRRFQTGMMLLWYPIKDAAAVDAFTDRAAGLGRGRLLLVEQWVRRADADGPLAGAGLLLVNPPYTLEAELAQALPELTQRLADGPGAGFRLEALRGE